VSGRLRLVPRGAVDEEVAFIVEERKQQLMGFSDATTGYSVNQLLK
jgi:hypothetical protein